MRWMSLATCAAMFAACGELLTPPEESNDRSALYGQLTSADTPGWLAHLSTTASGSQSYCGAAWIHDRYIVTARHCIQEDRSLPLGGLYDGTVHTEATGAKHLAVHGYTSRPDFAIVEVSPTPAGGTHETLKISCAATGPVSLYGRSFVTGGSPVQGVTGTSGSYQSRGWRKTTSHAVDHRMRTEALKFDRDALKEPPAMPVVSTTDRCGNAPSTLSTVLEEEGTAGLAADLAASVASGELAGRCLSDGFFLQDPSRAITPDTRGFYELGSGFTSGDSGSPAVDSSGHLIGVAANMRADKYKAWYPRRDAAWPSSLSMYPGILAAPSSGEDDDGLHWSHTTWNAAMICAGFQNPGYNLSARDPDTAFHECLLNVHGGSAEANVLPPWSYQASYVSPAFPKLIRRVLTPVLNHELEARADGATGSSTYQAAGAGPGIPETKVTPVFRVEVASESARAAWEASSEPRLPYQPLLQKILGAHDDHEIQFTAELIDLGTAIDCEADFAALPIDIPGAPLMEVRFEIYDGADETPAEVRIVPLTEVDLGLVNWLPNPVVFPGTPCLIHRETWSRPITVDIDAGVRDWVRTYRDSQATQGGGQTGKSAFDDISTVYQDMRVEVSVKVLHVPYGTHDLDAFMLHRGLSNARIVSTEDAATLADILDTNCE